MPPHGFRNGAPTGGSDMRKNDVDHRFDLIEGRSDEALAALLDATHRARVSSFGIPEGDRYQAIAQIPKYRNMPASHPMIWPRGGA